MQEQITSKTITYGEIVKIISEITKQKQTITTT